MPRWSCATRTTPQAHGLEPLAIVRSWASAGVPPADTGLGPTVAIPKALDRAGLTHRTTSTLVEINEAFASMAVACSRILGFPHEIVNVNGSGCSLGHPVAATGARMVTTLIYELRRRGGGIGVATMCAGGGMGSATVIEVPGRLIGSSGPVAVGSDDGPTGSVGKAMDLVTKRWWLTALDRRVRRVPADRSSSRYRVANPPVASEPNWDSPRPARSAVTACYDCHSNESQPLWFEKIAPLSWWITNHVDEGRSALNFSEWNTGGKGEADDIGRNRARRPACRRATTTGSASTRTAKLTRGRAPAARRRPEAHHRPVEVSRTRRSVT